MSSVVVARSSSLAVGAMPGPQRLPSEVPVFYAPTPSGRSVDYYYGIVGSSYDSWPSVGPHVKKVKIGKKGNEYQFFEFPQALNLSSDDPGPFCIPEELLQYQPSQDQVFKYFFKGTSREVSIRQIFFHTELTDKEQEWLRHIRDYCRWKNFPVRPCMEPFLLRICYYNWRKNGDRGYIPKAYDHILEIANWRANMFPLSDRDPEIMEDLKRGVMYWTARDEFFRPLLVVRLKRLPSSVSPTRFKRLTVFCFEWAMRYLFIPGLVETCTVLFDVRGIAIHSFPLSALSDMTNTLTRQYPFRLDRMFIINDSIFIQTVWSIAKQFLTEVQQQKMSFMRTGYAKELLKSYAPHHLEKEFGGTRAEITSFYPFPLEPGPFTPNAKAISPLTVEGKLWEGTSRPPIQWSAEAYDVFTSCGLTPPPGVPKPSPVLQPVVEKEADEAAGPAVSEASMLVSQSSLSEKHPAPSAKMSGDALPSDKGEHDQDLPSAASIHPEEQRWLDLITFPSSDSYCGSTARLPRALSHSSNNSKDASPSTQKTMDIQQQSIQISTDPSDADVTETPAQPSPQSADVVPEPEPSPDTTDTSPQSATKAWGASASPDIPEKCGSLETVSSKRSKVHSKQRRTAWWRFKRCRCWSKGGVREKR